MQNTLANLKDIHLPPAVSAWPPAPGWTGLMILIIVGCVIAFYYAKPLWQRYQQRRAAFNRLKEINALRETHALQACQALSALLRQIALIHHPREQFANLHGKNWLTFLDSTGNTTAFTQGAGQLLAQGPYQTQLSTLDSDMICLAKKWIKRNV